jgi:actin-related protein 8
MTTTAQDRDRALAQARPEELSGEPYMDIDDDVGIDESGGMLSGQDPLGSKVIVIHPGSQNLRIGLASDALPKTMPMVIAKKWEFSESEVGDGEPKPKRLKLEDGSDVEPEKMFGDEVGSPYSPRFITLIIASLQKNLPL